MEQQLAELRKQLEQLPDIEWDLYTHFCNLLLARRYPEVETRKLALENFTNACKDDKLPLVLQHVQFVLKDASMMSLIDNIILQTSPSTAIRKCSKRAQAAREHGNRLFLTGRPLDAIKSYNKALLIAPHTEKTAQSLLQVPNARNTGKRTCSELALAYGNRSAALYQLKEYERALLDIENSLLSGYPTEKIHVLFGRRILCIRALNKPEERVRSAIRGAMQQLRRRTKDANRLMQCEQFLEICAKRPLDGNQLPLSEDGRQSPVPFQPWLGTAASPSTPFVSPFASPAVSRTASLERDESKKMTETKNDDIKPECQLNSFADCVDIKYDTKLGRHLITKQQVLAGTLLLQEEAFSSWLRPSCNAMACYECLIPLSPLQFIPCSGCDQIRFCSRDCAKKSWNSYHEQECGQIDLIQPLALAHLALKLLWKGGLANASKYIGPMPSQSTKSKEKKKSDALRPILTGDKQVPEIANQNEYDLILRLTSNVQRIPASLALNFTLGAVLLGRLCIRLGLGSQSFKLIPLPILCSALLHHMLQLRCNVKAVELPEFIALQPIDFELPSESTIEQSNKCKTIPSGTQVAPSEQTVPSHWPNNDCLHEALNMLVAGPRRSLGVQLFPRLSLVNHGCASNAYTRRLASPNHVYTQLKSMQVLEEGSQVRLNYGCTWQQVTRDERREWLKAQYGFECECDACEKNFQCGAQAFRCDRCKPAISALGIANGEAKCVQCGYCIKGDELEEKLIQVQKLREQVEQLVEQDERLKSAEQGGKGEARADDVNYTHKLATCLEKAETLLHRDHDLLVDLHELSARNKERSGDYRESVRHWIAVFASSCLTQGFNSYDVLMATLEVSRLLCSSAAQEHEIASKIKITPVFNQLPNNEKRSAKRRSIKHKEPAENLLKEKQSMVEKRHQQHVERAERDRKAAQAYYNKASLIFGQLQGNEYQSLSVGSECIKRCALLLKQLSSLFEQKV